MQLFHFRIMPKVTPSATIGRMFVEIENFFIEDIVREEVFAQDLAGLVLIPIIADPGLVGSFEDRFSYKRKTKIILVEKNINFYDWRFASIDSRKYMARENIIDMLRAIPTRYISENLLDYLIKKAEMSI